MKKMSETIVFFGSGPVAAKSLELLTENFVVEAVITKPQPPHHKKVFPVLATAKKLKLKVLTPNSKSELSELFATKPVVSKAGVVIDYGLIINQDVIDYFPYGIINSHFSLLPEWRGADPITFAILSGQKQTGVSLMLIVAAMDEGPVLAQAPYELPRDITTPELTKELIKLSNKTLQSILPMYFQGKIHAVPQHQIAMPGHTQPSYSRKLTKADGILDWNKSAEQLEREIRAFLEWPKSQTTVAGKDVIITKAHIIEGSGIPGKLWRDGKNFGVYAAKNILAIDALKPSGKSEMTAEAFLAGYHLT